MANRQCLKNGNTILLKDQAGNSRDFEIGRVISEGATSICYEANCKGSGNGILKEYYPVDSSLQLKRDENGQLMPSENTWNTQEDFLGKKKKYAESYEKLLKYKQDSNNPDLATFIPPLDIYYGYDKNKGDIGSVYIWTEDAELETFDEYCKDVHENPTVAPEKKLVTILNAIYTLTDCVRILHCEGFLHRDIKPSNFGFKKFGGGILYQTLSMFDIHTACLVEEDDDVNLIVGTEEYLEPEAGTFPANNQTDIYAIGATLFQAIVITDETEKSGYFYKEEYYDHLHEMVKESKLIKASEANSHPRLTKLLTTILQKSLCERNDRYKDCEQMLDDLGKALYYALPTELAVKQLAGQKWVLEDVEKSIDPTKEKNSSLAIQYHLYEHPLYQEVKEEEQFINVLVIGFGNYGQKFLDACLQVGQIRDKGLSVTVISDDKEDQKIYLDERPALGEFFNVREVKDECANDGTLADSEKEIYGDILFSTRELSRNDVKANSDIIEKILTKHDNARKYPHYIFIALGDDNLNRTAATSCLDDVETLGWDCTVNYVIENGGINEEKFIGENVYPLFVNDKIEEHPLYTQIERMAFNTHLVWEKDLNIDFNKVKKEFQEPYNHDSCVGNVLSIKYKLHSIGIDLEPTDAGCTQAAKAFTEKITTKNEQLKNELIWIEHRRWVTEKLCLGWTRRDIKDCDDGKRKDDKKKQHICIVRSRPDQMLAEDWDRAKWDKHTKADLEKLDELDRMSVELHRFYVKRARIAQKQDMLSGEGNIIPEIRSLINDNKEATIAFQEWYDCLKDIWNGDTEKIYLYEGLKDAFLKETDSLSISQKDSLKHSMEDLDGQFMPILRSMEYNDWKSEDVALIDNIPFILTYNENICMIIPYSVGDKTAVFENVAAPTVVNPKKIIYFYYMDKESEWNEEWNEIEKSLSDVLEYMKKKRLRAQIDFILIHEENKQFEMIDNRIQELKSDIIDLAYPITAPTKEDIPNILQMELMHKYQEEILAIEKNNTNFSSYLEGNGFYKKFPHFAFDSKKITFNEICDCDMFGYIKKKPYITVSEMLALSKISDKRNSHPEFFDDYQKLWKLYRQNTKAWKALCECLKDYCDDKDVIETFEKSTDRRNLKQYTYIIPFSCKRSVDKILTYLKDPKHKLVESSGIQAYTPDSCKIIITDAYDNKDKFDDLFSQLYLLMIPEAISVYEDSKVIIVKLDRLVVSNASLQGKDRNNNQDLIKNMKQLARDLNKDGYIINLNINNNNDDISFTYGSRQIKELLTQEGKMLEIYVYHKILEQGQFNDVVSGYEINWEQSEVDNEFDVIATKSFQSLFVECKARAKIDQHFYYTLAALTSKFGVNAKAVIIADTEEKPGWFVVNNNDKQRQRGQEGWNIITISKEEEIEDIGNTLLSIINGTYESEGNMSS